MSRSIRTIGRAQALIDPAVFACWRLLAHQAGHLMRVRLLTARAAPRTAQVDGHEHAVPTVVVCLSGTTRVQHAQGALDLAAGEAAVVAPGAWHAHDPLRTGSVVYAQGLVGQRSDLMLVTPTQRWWAVIPAEPSALLLTRALAAGDERARVAHVRELLTQVVHESVQALRMTSCQQAMAGFLWSRFTEPIRARDILRVSGRSRARAYAQFCACFGEPPLRALTRARLDLARHLRAEGFPADEISRRCGLERVPRLTRLERRQRRG